ncbi:MAG TPA: hypothetical protein VL225_14845 [Vicinamibacterales bacterium]|nr:hypothetical protein [Vicinamibacterales bacterium]
MLIRSAELIGWALGGIEREIVETRNRLATLTARAAQLRRRAGTKAAAAVSDLSAGSAPGSPGRRRRRRMSPEARKRISEMMKKRWAERRRTKK